MNYFAPQNIFVCPYGQRDSHSGPVQGIIHFSLETNTFSDEYQHPEWGSCRHGSFLAKSKDHEFVGVLFSKDRQSMEDGSMVVINENGVEKIYDKDDLPQIKTTAYRRAGRGGDYLPTKFFFKTVGDDEYMYISWYSFRVRAEELKYISVTKNPVQFDSEGFPIFPVNKIMWDFKDQSAFAGQDYEMRGIISGGEYSEIDETLYTMARDAILAYKINASGVIEDAIAYPTDGANDTSARITVTKNYIIKTIIGQNGSVSSSSSINKSSKRSKELNINHVHAATADGSRIFRLRQNEVIQYMDYDETGDPADDSTWHEYKPTNGQLIPDRELGGYAVVKENPFSLVWDSRVAGK